LKIVLRCYRDADVWLKLDLIRSYNPELSDANPRFRNTSSV